MLKKLTVRNFKSLVDVSVEFPRLAVLFGAHAAGKAICWTPIAALSWIGNMLTSNAGDGLVENLLLRGLIGE